MTGAPLLDAETPGADWLRGGRTGCWLALQVPYGSFEFVERLTHWTVFEFVGSTASPPGHRP